MKDNNLLPSTGENRTHKIIGNHHNYIGNDIEHSKNKTNKTHDQTSVVQKVCFDR